MARGLTVAMRLALDRRQRDLLGAAATVFGPGMTMRALRSRGIVEGPMPFARLTTFGADVIRATKRAEVLPDARP